MIRKLTLGLATIAAVAAFVYFRHEPAAPPPPALAPALEKAPPASLAPTPSIPAPAPIASSSAAFKDLLEALPSLDPEQRDDAIRQLLRKLRAQGPEGLKTIADFLRSGRDAAIRDGYRMDGSRMVEAPTLRLALLDALQDWEGATAVLLDVLKSTANVWELTVAAKGLELAYPGTYREPAIAALKAGLARPQPAIGDGAEAHLFATTNHFKAVEILPELERFTIETRGPNVPRYLQLVNNLPAETRAPALQRLFSQPEISNEIEEAPQILNQWPYGDPKVQAFVAGVFSNRLNEQQRVAMLDGFDSATPVLNSDESLFTAKQDTRALEQAAAKEALAEAKARKEFLASLAKSPDQPKEVQGAIKDAQKRVTEDIAARQTAQRVESKPLVEVPIGLGEGKAQIKGRRIEQLEFRPAGVAPFDENSTGAADR